MLNCPCHTWITLGLPILGGLIAAAFGYFFSRRLYRFSRRIEGFSRITTSLDSHIQELEEISIKYWLVDYEEGSKLEQHFQEIRIKAIIKLIWSISKELSGRLKKDQIHLNNQLSEFNDRIYDLVTGDGFESQSKRASREKATKISMECSIIRSRIHVLGLTL